MSATRFPTLESVLLDESFPDVDLALRRGRHVDKDDAAWYALLVDGQDLLEPLYRRYGCELVAKSDGYFYLLPTNDKLGKRHLSAPEMLVGQALALLYLEPKTIETGGTVSREEVLSHLAGVVGSDVLLQALNPKRKRFDERIAAETVRAKITDALRRLSTLGFADAVDDTRYRLRAPLLRFAEPLRGAGSPAARLQSLVASGEIVLSEDALDEEGERDDSFDAPPEGGLAEPRAPEGDALSSDAPEGDALSSDAPEGDALSSDAPEPLARDEVASKAMLEPSGRLDAAEVDGRALLAGEAGSFDSEVLAPNANEPSQDGEHGP